MVPSRQHVGCQYLCYPSLAKLHYGLIDFDHDFMVVHWADFFC